MMHNAATEDRCADCNATAPRDSAGWEIDFPGNKRRARCPYHSTAGRLQRARARTEGPRCPRCADGYHRECVGGRCDCAVCRTFRPAPDATAPAGVQPRPALVLLAGGGR